MTRERTTSKDLNILILLVVVLLFISTVLVIVTFAVIFWLYNIPNGDKYGMWHGCAKNESLCSSWYENGPTLFSFPITGFRFKFDFMIKNELNLSFSF